MPTPASGQGHLAPGAGTLLLSCRAWCLCSAAPVVLLGLLDSMLLTALLPCCRSILLQPSLTCLQERTCATVLQAPREAKASWLRPQVSGESGEGTEGLGDGGAMGLAGAACPCHSPDEAGLLLPFSRGWGGKGLLTCLHAVRDQWTEGKPAVFAFGNKLVYMFFSSCTAVALESWVPVPAAL